MLAKAEEMFSDSKETELTVIQQMSRLFFDLFLELRNILLAQS